MKATWIWFPGDYEIWLGNNMNNRRTDRGAYFPPFWKQDSHYVTVEFSKEVNLADDEHIQIAVEGDYNVKIDGKMCFGMPNKLLLPKGHHRINIKVHNQATPPALYVCGQRFCSDASWRVTFEDKEWIDESGKASDTSATQYQMAGCWNFDSIENKPSAFQLPCIHQQAKDIQAIDTQHSIYDFGKETFGFAILEGVKGKGQVSLYYGESRQEAEDKDFCETYDVVPFEGPYVEQYRLPLSKAFRYVQVSCEEGVEVKMLSMDYEYMPENTPGSFRCSEEEINRIWDVGVYTMQLTTREFFIDGIKRDRWVWSGDAAQSYLMNYYLFDDKECVKRTIWLLAGKAPITSHINTIMDYTFYWFNSIADYYLYSGDKDFLKQIYPSMLSYMDYILGRTDQDGMVQGLSGDWVYIDWADEAMDKHGQLAFEQILFCKSLESMAMVAKTIDKQADAEKYSALATSLANKLLPFFWDETQKALVHNRIDGEKSQKVYRYANMFAIMYNYLDADKKEAALKSVIYNDRILKITTPYMRFYELEALCMLNNQTQVLSEIKSYWGGMLKKGATSFWEKYNPSEEGLDILAMYGRPYGKSLCHAWGASPIYLLGRYYLGIQPTEAGYARWEARPSLGGMAWMEGDVPTPYGQIHLKMDNKEVVIRSDGGHGTLFVNGQQIDVPAQSTIRVPIER